MFYSVIEILWSICTKLQFFIHWLRYCEIYVHGYGHKWILSALRVWMVLLHSGRNGLLIFLNIRLNVLFKTRAPLDRNMNINRDWYLQHQMIFNAKCPAFVFFLLRHGILSVMIYCHCFYLSQSNHVSQLSIKTPVDLFILMSWNLSSSH